jgi:hypothetical protein
MPEHRGELLRLEESLSRIVLGQAKAELPANFPAINFTGLYDQAIVTPVIGTPELSVLRAYAKQIGGKQLNAALNPPLQRFTAWGAATLLRRAPRRALPPGTGRARRSMIGVPEQLLLDALALA